MTFGTCRYCGQVVNLDYEEETQAEADIAASEKCECYDARHERNLRKQITAAQNRIRKIFGDDKRENQGRAQRNENVPVGGMTANERSV